MIGIVLQLADIKQQVSLMYDRRYGEHVEKGLVGVPRTVVEHQCLARTMRTQRRRQQRDGRGIGTRPLSHPRVAADNFVISEATHLFPRLRYVDDRVVCE